MIDAIVSKYGREVRETPMGFKYVVKIMGKEEIIVGGEESGGLTINNHLLEKDGILACLLVAEMVAGKRKPLREILNSLYKEVGTYIKERISI
jgi:phosphomannomutase